MMCDLIYILPAGREASAASISGTRSTGLLPSKRVTVPSGVTMNWDAKFHLMSLPDPPDAFKCT